MCMLYILVFFVFVRIRRPPRSTRPDPLFPYPTLFRSTQCTAGSVHLPNDWSEVEKPPVAMADMVWLIASNRFIPAAQKARRSEEHTSELQSLMRRSYAVF